MPVHIRINTQHLMHDDARMALRLARKVTKTTLKPMLTPPNPSGYYYAVIDDDRQLKVFLGFLMTASIKFVDRTDSMPQGAIRPKSPTGEASSPAKPIKEMVDELLDTLSGVFKPD
jgi:hypothetical protein